MPDSPIDLYLAGFRARAQARLGADCQLVDMVGACGTLSADGRLNIAVVDDTAHDAHDGVADLVAAARSGTVTVFDTAASCVELLQRQSGWAGSPATAMSCPDLDHVVTLALAAGLQSRTVRRTPDDDPRGVPLPDAAALAYAVDPGVESVDDLVEHLRNMPDQTHLTAAVDEHGVVQATSGYSVYGRHAQVMFVNTATAWQRRGVGAAMTSAAMTAARTAGAQHAFLDATTAGRGVYERLGFQVAAATTRFSRTA